MDTQGFLQDPYRALGDLLGRALFLSGKNQSWLAVQAGTSPAAISQFLAGQKRPKPIALAKMAICLGHNLDELLETGNYDRDQMARARNAYRQLLAPSLNLETFEEKLKWTHDEIMQGMPNVAMEHLEEVIGLLTDIQQKHLQDLSVRDQRSLLHLLAFAYYYYVRAGTTILPADELVVVDSLPEKMLEIADVIDDKDLRNRAHYLRADIRYVERRYDSSINNLNQIQTTGSDPEIELLSLRQKLSNSVYLSDTSSFEKLARQVQATIDKNSPSHSLWLPILIEALGRALSASGDPQQGHKLYETATNLYNKQPENQKWLYTELAIKRSQLGTILQTPDSPDIGIIENLVREIFILTRVLACRRVEQQVVRMLQKRGLR